MSEHDTATAVTPRRTALDYALALAPLAVLGYAAYVVLRNLTVIRQATPVIWPYAVQTHQESLVIVTAVLGAVCLGIVLLMPVLGVVRLLRVTRPQ